ncbi:HNH endonuclease [Ornithinimicrobium faecis]|uniref:HNH endonuclease n=1 Tax=Ornithinimicrobium faecis TaxID=2934158 RepID=UPI002119097E|nr:HNH endonuclease signature motif containing protein [Ornithinimicrobium sp. HY1745]
MSVETHREPPPTELPTEPPTELPTGPLTAAEVTGWLRRLAVGGGLAPLGATAAGDLCDLLGALESVKNATSAAQARATVLAAEALTEAAVAGGTPEATADKGVAQQLALARRESPFAGRRHVGFARAVVSEMPCTHAALTAGLISEWTATQIVKETACLSLAHRQAVDAHLEGRFGTDSHRALVAAATAKAYELDPYSVANRGRRARSDRRVSVRPAPDVMAIVSGYLPVADGVACYKALNEAAKGVKSAGDERSLDQIRADLFTQRLTGRVPAEGVNIELGLVMTDRALLGQDETPARLEGYGPIPAPMARDLVRDGQADSGDQGAQGLAQRAVVWLRRLYADPVTGVLVEQDSRRRTFTGALRRFLVARDQVCRTPWCDAPVRHADHVLPWARGGRTTADEGEGLCEACNYAKETTGWSHQVVDLPDGTHTVKITTPTGHTYYSQPPPVLPSLGDQGSAVPCADVPSAGVPRTQQRPWLNPETSGHGPETGRASAMSCTRESRVITLRLKDDETPRSASGSQRPPGRQASVKRRLLQFGAWRVTSHGGDDGTAHPTDPADQPSPLERHLSERLAQAV